MQYIYSKEKILQCTRYMQFKTSRDPRKAQASCNVKTTKMSWQGRGHIRCKIALSWIPQYVNHIRCKKQRRQASGSAGSHVSHVLYKKNRDTVPRPI